MNRFRQAALFPPNLYFSSLCFSSLLLVCCLLLAGCVPWTVRPLTDSKQAAATTQTPQAFADALWSQKLLPALRAQAVEATQLLPALAASPAQARKQYARSVEPGTAYYTVKGQGRVLDVNTTSRVGVANVDLPPYDGRADLTIQVGPVVRGVALRDATNLVPFSNFANQLEFADVAKALNDRALLQLQGQLSAQTKKNTPITFLGVAEAEDQAIPALRWLVLVEVEAGAAK